MAIAPTEFPAEAAVLKSTLRDPRPNLPRRLLRHRLAQIGLAVIGALLLAVLWTYAVDGLDPHYRRHIDPLYQFPIPVGISEVGEPRAPGHRFLLGTDSLGRDVASRVLYGARVSLEVGVFAMLASVLIGTTVGLISGYYGGWVDAVLMRSTDIVMSLPTVLLAIALVAVLPAEPLQLFGHSFDRHIVNLLIAIALVTWTGIARAVRGQVLSLREREFIEAARAVGASNARIVWRHLLPNVLPTIIVLATLATATNILLEAGLSYLGLGVEASTPSWGGMIAEGQSYILSAPWIVLSPGAAIVLAVVAFNLLGQALQETIG